MKIQTFENAKKKKNDQRIRQNQTTSTTKVTKPLIVQCDKIPLSIQQKISKELEPKSRFEI